MTVRHEDPRFVADMAAYFASQGKKVDGIPVAVEVEGHSQEWSYSEYTGGTDHRIGITLYLNEQDSTTGRWGYDILTIDDFDLADFMQFVYSRLPAPAAGA